MRIRLFPAVVALFLMCGSAAAQTSVRAAPYTYTVLGYQQLTLTGSAQSLTVPAGAKIAQICIETAAARYRDDGTDPTASVGMPVAVGTCFAYSGPAASGSNQPLTAIRWIAQSGSPVLNALYYF